MRERGREGERERGRERGREGERELVLVHSGFVHGETLVDKECLRAYSGVRDERKVLGCLLVNGGFVHGETLVNKEVPPGLMWRLK